MQATSTVLAAVIGDHAEPKDQRVAVDDVCKMLRYKLSLLQAGDERDGKRPAAAAHSAMNDQKHEQKGELREILARLEKWPYEALLVIAGALVFIALYFAL